MAFFDCNGLRLLLSLPKKEEFAHLSSVVYFQVNQMNETYERLLDNTLALMGEVQI